MKIYNLPIMLHEPSDYTEDKYLAEVPLLPGCRAWGNTASQAIENLPSVATAFIESYTERGDKLPMEVEAAPQDVSGPAVTSEVMVVVA
ncbi:MAG: type II toxin-antitoxin system HicB family antitoxin [Dehalococcoidia bacterium]|nr:type II toxin-antitoxin system HicB family antitoxin [Dehalococcoidia bacterium]